MSINFRIPPVSVTACAVATSLTVATGAWAAGTHFAGPGLGIGMPGMAADVTMTMPVVMTDNEYDSATISVRKGQTVRFVIKNKGDFVHEFNIGTATMHVAHREDERLGIASGSLELADSFRVFVASGDLVVHRALQGCFILPHQVMLLCRRDLRLRS